MKKLIVIIAILLTSCQFEFPNEDPTCSDLIKQINEEYNDSMANLDCVGKCDLSDQIKDIEKQRRDKLEKLNCN